MADHTESSGTGLRPYRSHFGSFPIVGYPESTASTFTYGDLVQLDQDAATNTHRVEAASSLSTGYVGIAADNASSNQDETRPVYVAHKDAEFIGWVKATILSSMVGQFRSFARDTSKGIDYLATNSSAGDLRVQITQVGLQDVAGGPYNIDDSNGYVAFRFLPEFTLFGKST